MAKFEIANAITGGNEGGYANNPADHGGETYAGIARKFWPNWSGWLTIDAIKSAHGAIPSVINAFARPDPLLKSMVLTFYKRNFWDVNQLDQINDQQVANNVYDCGVNCGIGAAAKMLQQLVSVTPDGIIGPRSIQSINGTDPESLYNAFNSARKNYYSDLIARNASQKQFQHSWFSRLIPYKHL